MDVFYFSKKKCTLGLLRVLAKGTRKEKTKNPGKLQH